MTAKILKLGSAALIGLTAMSAPALAEETMTSGESAYIFNTLLFLMAGFMVMFMAAGFAMLEAGMVRSKNVAIQCTKNISIFSIAGIMYYLVGYNLMYDGVDAGFIGSLSLWSPDDTGALADVPAFGEGEGYAAASDWYFQMVFVATAASIVSGTLAERIKLWPFLLFTVVLTGFIYPIQGAWQWGGGWLSEMGFSDFAGSTIVHSTGGWFGFNGGSQLALGSASNAIDVSQIFINTNMAAAAGVVTAMILTQLLYTKVDLTMALNGALAGLVSITAEPLTPTLGSAAMIGAVGGAIVVVTVPLLDKLKIDDVVGAIPVHLFAGIWGTMAVPLTNSVVLASLAFWLALKFTIGIRASQEEEVLGLDKTEIGLEAYPEFGAGSQRI